MVSWSVHASVQLCCGIHIHEKINLNSLNIGALELNFCDQSHRECSQLSKQGANTELDIKYNTIQALVR